jgi:K+-transporting ATPase ATPase A chain
MWGCGVDSRAESGWLHYAQSLLLFNLAGALFLYGVLRLQPWLPLSFGRGSVAPDLAFNTAISFATNTSWQAYAGEQVLGHAAQMLGLSSQCFLSCASGIATLAALTRGFARHSASNVGNFWADVIRITVHVLLPLAVVVSGLLVAQGAVQTLESSREWHTLEPTTWTQPAVDADGHAIIDAAGHGITESKTSDVQTVWLGPVASQTAIELLSGDGGGFYNANSSHPWANPTPLSNIVSMLAILLLPCALCFTFGHMVGDMRQGWALYAVMALVLAAMAVLAISAEQGGNPALQALVGGSQHDPLQGGNLEGKETRFGAAGSALFATVTTAGGDGAVNSMHDSYMPLGGLVPMVLMQLGDVIFGGPGSGLFGMLLYAITAVSVAGLMIGRAPEYLGKRIEAFDLQRDDGDCDVVRPVRSDCGRAGDRRVARGQEAAPGQRRRVADARGSVHRAATWHGVLDRRTNLCSGARPRARYRAYSNDSSEVNLVAGIGDVRPTVAGPWRRSASPCPDRARCGRSSPTDRHRSDRRR